MGPFGKTETGPERRITRSAVWRMRKGETIWDTDLTGFGVEASEGGKVYFLASGIGGERKNYVIGRHGEPWTPETARAEAWRMKSELMRTADTGGSNSSAGPPVSVLRESGFATGGPIVSSLPPISSERPYEEEDLGSLEDGGVPRAVRASRAFAASGASLASAVTDGFTVDDASTKSENSAQGEDGGDVSVDGSDSSKFSLIGTFAFITSVSVPPFHASNLSFPFTLHSITSCTQLPRPLAQDIELLIPSSWIQRFEEKSVFTVFRPGRPGAATMGTVIRL